MRRNSQNSELIPFDPEIERTYRRRRNFFREIAVAFYLKTLEALHQEFVAESAPQEEDKPSVIPTPPFIMPKLSTHSMPSAAYIPQGFTLPGTVTGNFEIKPAFISLVERNQFGGSAKEDPHAHIRVFCDYCSTIKQNGVTQDQIREMMFPFSLRDRAREWITDLDKEALGIEDWNGLALAFYQKYYPPEKTNMLRSQITSF